ncbi:MAG TPA: hypothetical protein VFW66_09625 [Gemmatimonadales bacterium]|nr:hypothetical protein [Gemmatimonadales bacterium]
MFVVGMGLIAAVHHGVLRAKTLAHSTEPVDIPLAMLPFQVDGSKLGTLRGIEFTRSAPDDVTGMRVSVRLSDSGKAKLLDGCVLAIGSANVQSDARSLGFRCLRGGDSSLAGLKRFGEVVLQPGGVVLSVMVPRDR